MEYRVSHPKLELKIKLKELGKLYIHEEIIPEIVERLSDEIKRGMHVKHPVIVDKETLVVLDGMHRVAALQHLGHKLIPICLVNYNNPTITVGSWFRTIENGQKTDENIRKDLEELGYNLQRIADNELKRKIYDREIIIGIVMSRECYGIPGKIESIKETYEYIKRLERNLRSVGYKIGTKQKTML